MKQKHNKRENKINLHDLKVGDVCVILFVDSVSKLGPWKFVSMVTEEYNPDNDDDDVEMVDLLDLSDDADALAGNISTDTSWSAGPNDNTVTVIEILFNVPEMPETVSMTKQAQKRLAKDYPELLL